MIHSKNSYGFTLIEVLFAVAIIAMSMSAIFVLELSTARAATRYAQFIERIIQAKNFFLTSHAMVPNDTRSLVLEKIVKKPTTKLVYEIKEVSDSSSLKKIKDIRTELVTLQWQENNRMRTETLVTFVFKPERKKE